MSQRRKKAKPAVRRKLQESVKEAAAEVSNQDIAFEVAATFKVRDVHGDLTERLSEIYYLLKTGS
jgi:hypothetical protein